MTDEEVRKYTLNELLKMRAFAEEQFSEIEQAFHEGRGEDADMLLRTFCEKMQFTILETENTILRDTALLYRGENQYLKNMAERQSMSHKIRKAKRRDDAENPEENRRNQ